MHALAQQIDDNPDDLDAFRAYGDWLEQQGDPRGQLMAMHVLRERITDRSKLVYLDTKIEAFFEQHRDHFLGRLAKLVPKPTASRKARDNARQHFQWRYGFIYKATLQRQAKPPLHDILAWLLDHPSGRFLVDLSFDSAEDPRAFHDILFARMPRSLRRLAMGSNDVDLSPLWPRAQNLRCFEVGFGGALGEMSLPEAREVRFHRVYAPAMARAIAAAHLPKLEILELEIGLDPGLDDVMPVLEREYPHLHTLALGAGNDINPILAAFAKLPLARQIRTLDLSNNYFIDDTGAGAIASLGRIYDKLLIHPRASLTPPRRAMLASATRELVEAEPAESAGR